MIKHYCIISILFLCSSTALHSKDEIIWATNSWPPFTIVEGPNKEKGITDVLVNYLQKNLPGYDHKRKRMNYIRYFASAKNGHNICMAGLLKTAQRESIVHYSIPTALGLPQSVVTKRAIAKKYFGDVDEISIEKILQNAKLKVIFQKKRSYGIIDQYINKFKHQNNIEISLNRNISVFQMLQTDRIQYMVEYPYAIADMIKDSHQKGAEIITLKIKELPPFIRAHVTCSKTAWGKRVIDQINQVVRSKKNSPEYQTIFGDQEKYLDKKAIQRHKRLYFDEFLKMK